MGKRSLVSLVFACALILGMFILPVHAAEEKPTTLGRNSFSTTIPKNKTAVAGHEISVAQGDTVKIEVQYSPFYESLDVGLKDMDGVYHYQTMTGGNGDVTIQIQTSGNYTLQFRNNSDSEISVSGTISY